MFTLLDLFENEQLSKIWLASHLNKKLYKTQILDTNIVETINTILHSEVLRIIVFISIIAISFVNKLFY